MKTTLVIMAAGLGARFGGGIKQLEPVGSHGEIIMDYSIHDAIEAGFNKIIVIIRKDIEEDFKLVIGNRIEKVCRELNVEIEYAFQNLNDVPEGFTVPAGRKKPWGTCHAVLACKNLIKEPFVVINADDYYGKEAFQKLYEFLCEYDPNRPCSLAMAGFILKNTLSDNGGVTRGICKMNEEGYLTSVDETKSIVKSVSGGKVSASANGKDVDIESLVSMNMWALTPEFVKMMDEGFAYFLSSLEKGSEEELKKEYLLPIYINDMLQKGRVSVKVLATGDKWFGVTYKDDKEAVAKAFKKLIADGVYKENLDSDLIFL